MSRNYQKNLLRPLLADPAFVRKASQGRADEINTCIACNQACLDHVFKQEVASCLVNPRAGHETLLVAAALDAWCAGTDHDLDLAIDLGAAGLSPFHRTVLETLRREVGWGEVVTYGELAALAGRPGAARAVGAAMATNPLPFVIPCHRVVASAGGGRRRIGGYRPSMIAGADRSRGNVTQADSVATQQHASSTRAKATLLTSAPWFL